MDLSQSQDRYKKKLIEVSLPLEAINAASSREKSIRHGHPSTLHLWWARRPLAAARAVIWSSLVDDPSAHPEEFPTEEDQKRERERLFKILEDLVVWENSNNPDVLTAAKAEILKSTDGNPPALLDPFAGGGAIPLEAQRLGLEAHAHDLNPVAVMINKAMIEIPPRFADLAPVNPDACVSTSKETWSGANGLAEDVRYYGEWMKKEAYKRIGHLYPKVKVPKEQGGGEATVIAWIWARTVKCPNPACGCEMPLAKSFVLSKKKGNEACIEPQIDYINKKITYKVRTGKGKVPESPKTARGAKFKCIMCGESAQDDYIKQEGLNGSMGSVLMGIVAEGDHGRIYISPDEEQISISCCDKPQGEYPTQELPYEPRAIWCVGYGLNTYDKLFTNRQLTAMTTFSSLVREAQQKAEEDSIAAGMKNDHLSLWSGGSNAKAYSEAVAVYLAFLIDQMANQTSSLCGWHASNVQIRSVFSRQAIPMVWDYAECNVFSHSTGSYENLLERMVKGIRYLGNGPMGCADQYNAQMDCGLRNIMVSMDPPYYDNIGYADLSDFFYVWMRQSLKDIYPELFSTMLVPKAEELIATPYRHEGSTEKAKSFFEDGMAATCRQIALYAREDVPVTIYYAYKQSDTDEEEKTASSGWETMLNAIIQAGFAITGTWPISTELATRQLSQGTNALASSIVLVCRKRPKGAPQTTRRSFVNALRRELRTALKNMQQSNIAPVDFAQSAIGPGMGVFSRYRRVLEADGTPMTVRSALHIINQEVDRYFNEQVGDLDAASRFCVDLYTQFAYNDVKYGEAQVLANAKNTSISRLEAEGIVYAKGGNVHLIERAALPQKADPDQANIWLLTQQLTQAMATGGVLACARMIRPLLGSDAERARDLAYRLYTIAEQKKWTEEAYAYNSLVVSWMDIQTRATQMEAEEPVQLSLFDNDET